MIKDYHLHPQIVQNEKNFDLFAQKALDKGIEEVCITDHMPLIGSAVSDRIPCGRVEEYCFKAQKIQEKYRGTISVKVGIEIDYHPTIINQIEAVLKCGSFDYILGSSHLHAIGELDIWNKSKTRNNYAKFMLENTVSAAKSGYFNAIAHIDMYHWIFSNPLRFTLEDDSFAEDRHISLINDALDAIKKNNLYLEINPHFAASLKNVQSTYPSVGIVTLALEKGIKFSYGSDAHTAEAVGEMLTDLRNHNIYGQALSTWES